MKWFEAVLTRIAFVPGYNLGENVLNEHIFILTDKNRKYLVEFNK